VLSARGLKVLDLSRGIAGALAGRLLADCGAEVVRIAHPERDWPGRDPAVLTWQFGKRTRALDLSTAQGRGALRALAAGADVLIEGFRPGRMEGWGLGYEALSHGNPGLVYCAVTGYGPDGPLAGAPGYEGLVQAYSGVAGDQVGFREGPVPVAVPLASVEAGLLAAMGVFAALLARERGLGRGQRVDTSLLAGAMVMQTAVLTRSEGLPSTPHPQDPLGAMPAFRLYECADGAWIQVAGLHPDFFQRMVVALGIAEVLLDPRFDLAPNRYASAADREALVEILRARFRAEAAETWLRALGEADVPCAPVQDARDLWGDPLFRDSGILVERDAAGFGRVRHVGPVFVGAAAEAAAGPVPGLAEGRAPLDGLRVLELGGYQAGPTGGRLLADLGADVVKLEPLDGDPFRSTGNIFLALNHGKRSFAVDLGSDEGRRAVRRLAETCPVVLHNLRPGVAERAGLGYAELATANPGLVYVQISGFGAEGPVAARPAYDPLGQALAGIERAQGGPAENPPSLVRSAVCDVSSGTVAALAAIAGLLGRQRGGRGGRAETSLLRMGAALTAETALGYGGRPPARVFDRGQHGFGPLYRLYGTADGWLFLAARSGDWPGLRAALGLAGEPDAAALEAALAQRSTADCLALLRAAGAAAEPVVFELARRFADDPQVRAQGLVAEVEHPAYGRAQYVGPPVRLSATPARLGPPAPALGEHTEALLAEVGYDAGERTALRERGIVGWGAGWPT
jgi:crotonobetainyl-CoA:carnitine CoA-transferase CaiB-like acyl-CoA transferase